VGHLINVYSSKEWPPLSRGDAANAGLAVAGYINFRRLIRWLRLLLRQILSAEPAIKPSLGCLAAGPLKKCLI
jgi:hypothetical protein